jgi:CIC family chloride channel protein
MFRNNIFRKILKTKFTDIDQRRLIYILSLTVGLLSAVAAAILKNAIHYTHLFLTEAINSGPVSYIYLALPISGMFITLLFVKYIVKDNIGQGIAVTPY